ncbi:MAG: hypothetical protein PHT12_04820 [Patescibacteria group bacterium]|nr:hypothetical protein [Patescibacteria group bacterium]
MDLQAYENLALNQPVASPAIAAPTPTPIVIPAASAERPQPFLVKNTVNLAENKPNETPTPLKAGKREKRLPNQPTSLSAAPADLMDFAGLTQEDLLDKINRDIGAWKNAQERKRTEELQSVARPAIKTGFSARLEEEEHFYLEPIE